MARSSTSRAIISETLPSTSIPTAMIAASRAPVRLAPSMRGTAAARSSQPVPSGCPRPTPPHPSSSRHPRNLMVSTHGWCTPTHPYHLQAWDDRQSPRKAGMTGRFVAGEVDRVRQDISRCPAWGGAGPPFASRGRGSSRLGSLSPASQGITRRAWRRLFVRLSVADLQLQNLGETVVDLEPVRMRDVDGVPERGERFSAERLRFNHGAASRTHGSGKCRRPDESSL